MSEQDQASQEKGEGGGGGGGLIQGPKATLERLGDITLSGKFAINLRILLEPIGFLRILLVVLCLLAFSLTAGFSSNGSNNQAFCDTNENVTVMITLSFSYPYRINSFSFVYSPPLNTSAPLTCTAAINFKAFSGSAEYYVFMSTVSFLYGILALVAYVLFYVPRYDISKYFSVVDLIATVILAFFFFLADIAWSAGSNQLGSYSEELLNSRISDTNCVQCGPNIPHPATQNFSQLSVSLLFGWVATLVLIASIWFIYKDTIIHLNSMGPLYQLSFIRKRDHQQQERSEEGRPSEREVGMQQQEVEQTGGGDGGGGGGGWDDNTSPDSEDKW